MTLQPLRSYRFSVVVTASLGHRSLCYLCGHSQENTCRRNLLCVSSGSQSDAHHRGRRRMALGWKVLGSPVSSSTTALAAEALPTRLLQPPGRHSLHQHRVTVNGQASTSGDSSSRSLSSRGKSSTRAWQHQWRYMRSEKERTNRNLPKVDWNRYHLQVSVRRTSVPSGLLSYAGCGRLTTVLPFSSISPQTIIQAHSRSIVSCICALTRRRRQLSALTPGGDSFVCRPDPFCGSHRHSACPSGSWLA